MKISINLKIILLAFIICSTFNLSMAQISGCTDTKANNFNPAATINDGSCTYNGSNLAPLMSKNLDAAVVETSGLIFWNNTLWTHNDDTDNRLYSLDTATGTILDSKVLSSTINKDWEEISQDEQYIYVGDFGNNSNGNRTDLHILRIEKNAFLLNAPVIDTIYFSYADQTNFTPTGANNTDFDCEAFLVSNDSIYLFTKQWVSEKTNIYVLPKTPGIHTAMLRAVINIRGLATGITYLESKRLAVIIGYSKLLQPFLYVLYDFNNYDFSSGNKRKIDVNLLFHQVEGIATSNGLKYYVSNEKISSPFNIPNKLLTFDLSNYLNTYLAGIPTNISVSKKDEKMIVFPNPSSDNFQLSVSQKFIGTHCEIYNSNGVRITQFQIKDSNITLQNSLFPTPGIYILCIEGEENFLKLVKI